METILIYLGKWALSIKNNFKNILKLINSFTYWSFVAPIKGKGLRLKETVNQMVRIGYQAVPLVFLISFFIGLIMAMQSAYQLRKFGAEIYVADLVAVSITRELGPLLTAIIVAARSGSSIAAEIGTMRVSEEIDALTSLALNPIKFLVVPKLLALMIVLPCLTVLGDLVGIIGGFLMGIINLNLSPVQYFHHTINSLQMKDIITGLIKSGIFAWIIAQIGSYEGFLVKGGAEGVGKSTTKAVVSSIFFIILADVIFTAIFYFWT